VPRPHRLVLAALVALAASACSSDDSSSSTSATSATSAATTTVAATTTGGPTTTLEPDGLVAGKPFAVAAQYVVYGSVSKAWRLHLLPEDHSCSEELADVAPAIGIDFPADTPAQLPKTGPQTDVGVVFIPARPNDTGPMTTTVGVDLTLDEVTVDPGGHWKGHLKVDQFDSAAGTNAIDVDIDATVCSQRND
jgi:hypothetical protein